MNFTEIVKKFESMEEKAIFYIEYSNDFNSFVYEYDSFETNYGRFTHGWFCEKESDLNLPNSNVIDWVKMTRKEFISFKQQKEMLMDIIRLFNCEEIKIEDAIFVTENEEINIPMYSAIDNSFLGNFKSITDAEKVFISHVHKCDYYWVDFMRCKIKMDIKFDNTVFIAVSALEY